MTSWAVIALSSMLLFSQTFPGQVPDRVLLNATFQGKEIGFDFVHLECMRIPNAPHASGCWLDEILLTGCESGGTAVLFPRHYDIQDLVVNGDLLKREITVEVQGAGTTTTFRFNYHPSLVMSAAYILTNATMTHRDSVTKKGFEWQAMKGRDATIKLPCAIKANGLWDRRDLP
jgi:hypothetical protein